MNGRPSMGGRDDRRRPQSGLRVNHRIRVPEVRVVGDNGEAFGVMPTHEALRLAEDKGLDLIEISPRAVPPVCKLADFGKYKYELSKKNKQARKNASVVELKEIKLRVLTEEHDLEFKTKHIRRFLEDGNKVRLLVTFRGREIAHPQTGVAALKRVVGMVEDIAVIEAHPNLEGKRMIMVIGPKPGLARKVADAKRAALAAGGAQAAAIKAADEALAKDNYDGDQDDDDDDDLDDDIDGATGDAGSANQR